MNTATAAQLKSFEELLRPVMFVRQRHSDPQADLSGSDPHWQSLLDGVEESLFYLEGGFPSSLKKAFCWQVPEILFDYEGRGIQHIAVDALSHVADHVDRIELLQSVIVVGGSARIPGLAQRLQAELEVLLDAEGNESIQVLSSPMNPSLASWRGGSMLANSKAFGLGVEVLGGWISKASYDRIGASAARLHYEPRRIKGEVVTSAFPSVGGGKSPFVLGLARSESNEDYSGFQTTTPAKLEEQIKARSVTQESVDKLLVWDDVEVDCVPYGSVRTAWAASDPDLELYYLRNADAVKAKVITLHVSMQEHDFVMVKCINVGGCEVGNLHMKSDRNVGWLRMSLASKLQIFPHQLRLVDACGQCFDDEDSLGVVAESDIQTSIGSPKHVDVHHEPSVLMQDGQEFSIILQNRDPLHYASIQITVNGTTQVGEFIMGPGDVAFLQRPLSEQKRLTFAAADLACFAAAGSKSDLSSNGEVRVLWQRARCLCDAILENCNHEVCTDCDDVVPVVIEIGSSESRVGFAGDAAPSAVFPSLVGRPKMPGIMVGMDQKDSYVGHEAESRRGVLAMKGVLECAIKEGVVTFTRDSDQEFETASVWIEFDENCPCTSSADLRFKLVAAASTCGNDAVRD